MPPGARRWTLRGSAGTLIDVKLSTLAACALTVSLLGCGGADRKPSAAPATPAADPPQEPTSDERAGADVPTVSAEIGGLPPEGVAKTFRKAEDKIFKCFSAGVERVPFMGGAVRFWVKVDGRGKFLHAHLERSDLGDRATEQCLLDVLMGYKWPLPVGGEVGVATFEMSFEHAPDIQPPLPWAEDKVAQVVEALAEPLEECKFGLPGEFTATVYVKREARAAAEGSGASAGAEAEAQNVGRAITASATPPDEAGEMAIDCIAKVLREATYPDPGEQPVKVSFKL
jgi:hypothetical protein